MGGGGGQTTGNSNGGVSGQGAGVAVGAKGGMGIEIAMMDANKKLMESQARKNNVEADKLAGVDTNKTKAETDLIRQQEEIAKIAASVSRQTINEQMKSWENLIKKQEADIKQVGLANKYTEETMNDQKQLLRNQVVAEAAKTAMINSDINRNGVLNKVSDAQWQMLVQDLWMNRDKFSEEKLNNLWMRWKIQNDIGGGLS